MRFRESVSAPPVQRLRYSNRSRGHVYLDRTRVCKLPLTLSLLLLLLPLLPLLLPPPLPLKLLLLLPLPKLLLLLLPSLLLLRSIQQQFLILGIQISVLTSDRSLYPDAVE